MIFNPFALFLSLGNNIFSMSQENSFDNTGSDQPSSQPTQGQEQTVQSPPPMNDVSTIVEGKKSYDYGTDDGYQRE